MFQSQSPSNCKFTRHLICFLKAILYRSYCPWWLSKCLWRELAWESLNYWLTPSTLGSILHSSLMLQIALALPTHVCAKEGVQCQQRQIDSCELVILHTIYVCNDQLDLLTIKAFIAVWPNLNENFCISDQTLGKYLFLNILTCDDSKMYYLLNKCLDMQEPYRYTVFLLCI